MLKIGYGMLMLAAACVVAYVAYHVIRILVLAPGIHSFFKAAILVAAVGLVLVLIGLVRERRREERDASDDDGDR